MKNEAELPLGLCEALSVEVEVIVREEAGSEKGCG